MDFLRDDTAVALDQVQRACRKAADVHRTVADALEDADLAERLRRLADERDRAVDWLVAELHRRHDGPRRPPEEIQLLKKAAVWAESLVDQDRATVLQHCIGEEGAVAEAAAEAIGATDESDLRRRLEDLRIDAGGQAEVLSGLAASS